MDLDPPRQLLVKLIANAETDLASVSRGIGKNHAYLQQYLKTGKPRELPERVREALSIHFGDVSPDMFRLSPPPSSAARSLPPAIRDLIKIDGEDYTLLPVYDLRLSAGPGAYCGDDSEPLRWEPHRFQWLRSITASSPERLILARVDGDSMETTLFHGDHVLIDQSHRNINRDGIYGYRVGDALNVKRVSVDPRTRLLTIISDNPRYQPYPDTNPDELDVVGRVIWLGRQV